MNVRSALARCVLLSCLGAPAGAQGQVWIVDHAGGPGADYFALHPAVLAAQDGDVLLVRPGYYVVHTELDGRGITIQGDGEDVSVFAGLHVRNLAEDQRVVLRDVEFVNATFTLRNNAGIVWIEDCVIMTDQYSGSGSTAAILVDRARLVLDDTPVYGSLPYGFHGSPPTDGIVAWASTISMTGDFAHGGNGRDTNYPHFPGAEGIDAFASTLVLDDVFLLGGLGYTQPGGAGIALTGGAHARLRGSTARGGTGTPDAPDTTVDATSSLTLESAAPPVIGTSSPLRSRELFELTVQGTPGDAVVLHAGFDPALDVHPLGHGVRLVEPSSGGSPIFLGVVPASGTLTYSAPVPALVAGTALQVFLQTRHVPLAGGKSRRAPTDPLWRGVTSSGSAVLLLGPGH